MWKCLPSTGVAVEVGDRVAVAADLDDLVLAELDGLAGELDEGGDVAAEERLAVADADDQRRVAARGDDRRPGCSASTRTSVNAPSQPAADGAHRVGERAAVRATSAPTRCATVSVSVSLANSTPAASSSARSSAKFSMMPLCTTAMRPVASVCGCALRSFGAPWVAQRVWPMPVVPVIVRLASSLSRFSIRPAFLATCSVPSGPTTATPAES